MTRATVPELLSRLRSERLKSIDLIAQLTPRDLDTTSMIRGRTVREMLWMMEEHYRVHRTQIHNNRIAAEERSNEIHSLLAGAQATFEAVLTLVISLSDDGANSSPRNGEWTVREVLEHLLQFEERYRQEFERLLEEGRTPSEN